MKKSMISISTLIILLMSGCSGGGVDTSLYAVYNSVYGVNALSTDENISLHVGDEVIETVIPYDQNASVIEKAVGSDNHAYYSVGVSGDYGDTVLQNSRTYFYAATDCNDTVGLQDHLYHMVETDTQLNIVNTSSAIFTDSDINISVDGVQMNGANTNACAVTSVITPTAIDQNISVRFGGVLSVWKVLPSDVSVDVVIYGTPPTEAAIISLPRLTPDSI